MLLAHLVHTLLKANSKTDNRNPWLSLITVVISVPGFISLYLYCTITERPNGTLQVTLCVYVKCDDDSEMELDFSVFHSSGLRSLIYSFRLTCVVDSSCSSVTHVSRHSLNVTVSARDLLQSLSTVNHCSAGWRNCILYFSAAHSSTWISSWIKKRGNSQPAP